MDTGPSPYPPPPPAEEPGRAPVAQPASPRRSGSTKATWFLLGAGAGCLGALVLAALVALPAVFLLQKRSAPSMMGPMAVGPTGSAPSVGPGGFPVTPLGLPGTDNIREWEYSPGPRDEAEGLLFHYELQQFVFNNYGTRAERDLGAIHRVRMESDHPWPEPKGQVVFRLSADDGREVAIAVDYNETPGGTWQFTLHEYKGP